jgi:hypothetical protein
LNHVHIVLKLSAFGKFITLNPAANGDSVSIS